MSKKEIREFFHLPWFIPTLLWHEWTYSGRFPWPNYWKMLRDSHYRYLYLRGSFRPDLLNKIIFLIWKIEKKLRKIYEYCPH